MILRKISFCLDKVDNLKKFEIPMYKKVDDETDEEIDSLDSPSANDHHSTVKYDVENYLIYLFYPTFNTFAPYITPYNFLSTVNKFLKTRLFRFSDFLLSCKLIFLKFLTNKKV